MTNTIVANYGTTNCVGGFGSGGHNIDSDGSCFDSGGSDLPNTKPQLSVLRDNGGPTRTLALCTGAGSAPSCHGVSPAIDAGDNAACPATDQRGFSRPAGAACDIGAYEVQ
jgi:hypothetical protein